MTIQAVIRAVVYRMSDFNMFLDPAVEARFFGDDPFNNWLNSYNAFFYVVMSLLTPFARWFSILIWTFLSVMVFIYSIAIVRSLLPKPIKAPRLEVFVVPLLLFVLIFDNIQLGQTNMVMMFAVLVSIFYLNRQKDLKAGLALGFAIAYKVTPLIFVGYFILKKRFLAAFYSALFALIMMAFVPMLFYTPENSLGYFADWVEVVLAPFLSGEEIKTLNVGYYHTNQSLEAFLSRHFTSFGEEKYGGWHRIINLSYWSADQVKTIGNIIKLLVIIMLSAVTFFNRNRKPIVLMSEAALFLMAILILSPSSWVNHYILITPACIYLVNEIFSLPRSNPGRKWLIFWLGLATLLITSGVSVVLQSYSVLFLALLIIFPAVMVHHYRYNFKPSRTHRADS